MLPVDLRVGEDLHWHFDLQALHQMVLCLFESAHRTGQDAVSKGYLFEKGKLGNEHQVKFSVGQHRIGGKGHIIAHFIGIGNKNDKRPDGNHPVIKRNDGRLCPVLKGCRNCGLYIGKKHPFSGMLVLSDDHGVDADAGVAEKIMLVDPSRIYSYFPSFPDHFKGFSDLMRYVQMRGQAVSRPQRDDSQLHIGADQAGSHLIYGSVASAGDDNVGIMLEGLLREDKRVLSAHGVVCPDLIPVRGKKLPDVKIGHAVPSCSGDRIYYEMYIGHRLF